jgi:hypothetical protein
MKVDSRFKSYNERIQELVTQGMASIEAEKQIESESDLSTIASAAAEVDNFMLNHQFDEAEKANQEFVNSMMKE